MMYGNYTEERDHRDYDKNYRCIKYVLYATNLTLLLCAMIMLGGAIYILVEKTFISDIMQNQLLTAATWLCIVGGSLIILSIPICGCCGTARESKRLLTAYIVILSLMFLVFLAGGICAVVLRGEIGEWIISKMEQSLKDDYGVKLDNRYNRFVTQQWDKAQEDMYCCAVREQGWGLYKQSKWYAEQPARYGDRTSSNQGKNLVPKSCCKRNRDNRIEDQEKCQRYVEGPPFKQSGDVGSNLYNNALHYRGCYEAGKYWIRYNGGWIIGFGIGFAGALILAIILSVILLLRLRK